MIFSETKLFGTYVIEIEKLEDERGFFARTFDQEEFSKYNLDIDFLQSSISHNIKKGSIRGMHYQEKPYQESKIIRCTKGSVFDVVIDLRVDSTTFKKWFSVELSEKNYKMLYIPKGFAHGFQTLEDNSEVFYQISQKYNTKCSRGIKWNDREFNIKWPLEVTVISNRDKSFQKYSGDKK